MNARASAKPPFSVGAVLLDLLRNPGFHFVEKWNWKSAVTSALIRAIIFLFATISAGWQAASGAMLVEFCFRMVTAGFYGSATQALRKAEPAWLAATVAMILLPVTSHLLQYLVHWALATPKLEKGMITSILFTAVSTLFNLYVMRHGVLLVGAGEQSLASDLRRMPGLIASFVAVIPMALWRSVRGERPRT